MLASRTEEVEMLRRNMRGTRFQEMEAELAAYTQECQRLRL